MPVGHLGMTASLAQKTRFELRGDLAATAAFPGRELDHGSPRNPPVREPRNRVVQVRCFGGPDGLEVVDALLPRAGRGASAHPRLLCRGRHRAGVLDARRDAVAVAWNAAEAHSMIVAICMPAPSRIRAAPGTAAKTRLANPTSASACSARQNACVAIWQTR
jgi:hypothetical protein